LKVSEKELHFSFSFLRFVHQQLLLLWQQLLQALSRNCQPFDGPLLLQIDSLLLIGFANKFKKIKGVTIDFWQNTFSEQATGELQYSQALTEVLKQLRQSLGADIKVSEQEQLKEEKVR
jgi:hypothetical protein